MALGGAARVGGVDGGDDGGDEVPFCGGGAPGGDGYDVAFDADFAFIVSEEFVVMVEVLWVGVSGGKDGGRR